MQSGMTMTFKFYFMHLDPGEKQALADAVGTSYQYLCQIANGHKNAGPVLCRKIEQATNGQVSRHDLRPDIYSSER